MQIENPENFEKLNVHKVYEKISNHFDKTRYHTWPIIKNFVDSIPKNSLVGDIGCGNGRNCLIRDDCHFIGTDISESFVNICQSKGIKCLLANNLDLPFSDNKFDYLMSIAVIHHFCTEERRIKAISELIRVLKINGKVLIYVWAKEQKKFSNKYNNDILVPWNLQMNYNKGEDKIYNRYYHLFCQGELERLITNFSNIEIIENGYQKDNWYLILKKKY